MPPANSPSDTPAGAHVSAPYFGLASEATASVPNLASNLGPEDDDADLDNIRFLRSALAQLDGDPRLETPRHTERRRDPAENVTLTSNITPSERETVRRLRRYVLQGRTTPTPHRDSHHRLRTARDTNRPTEYQGWAPGSSEHENNGEPSFTFSDLRALARGYTRGAPENSTQSYYRDHTGESPRISSGIERDRPGRRVVLENAEMDWEPSQFLYTNWDPASADSSLRTTALLQSVRRHARFSPRPTSQNEHNSALTERDFTLRRIRSTSTRDTAADPNIPPLQPRVGARQETPNSEASRWLEEAIKYLERLRTCQSTSQRMQSAAAGGFVSGKFFVGQSRTNDFVMDTTHIPAPPRSSWLRPGSVFSGFQKSTTSINLSLSNARSQPSRRRQVRGVESDERNSSINSNINNSNSQHTPPPPGAWINRVLSRSGGQESGIGASSGPSNRACACHEDSWPVKVTITSIDYETMRLTGTMEAFNVPNKACPTQESTIATYLEGEIIDFNQYTLETISFNAKSSIDSTYWRELEPFRSLPDHTLVQSLLSQKWLREELGEKYILMRWKEKCFITPADAQVHLTISGFYYVSLRRSDGRLEGLYYDPTSTPYQHLTLKADSRQFPAVEMR